MDFNRSLVVIMFLLSANMRCEGTNDMEGTAISDFSKDHTTWEGSVIFIFFDYFSPVLSTESYVDD